jgi:polysaccharide export outer membrane protein
MRSEKSKFPAKLLWLAFPILIASPCPAQQPDTPTLKPNPTATLQAFEPPADAPYELGRGDEITVEAIGRPELTGKHVIGPDGKITMPITGAVNIADMTRDQAAAAIEQALSPYFTGITISIGVDRYTSNQITLLGAVEHPGIMTFDKTPTLLDVISRAGYSTSGSNVVGQSEAGSKPSGIPEEVIIYRGNDTMATVELQQLVGEGSPLANMRLKRGDLVYVTGRNKYISVLGQVTHPGNLRLEPTTTLSDLLAQAGGPTEKAGRNPSIQIIHPATATAPARTQVIPYKSLLQHHNDSEISFQSGDILFVPESGFNGASYTLQQLAPLVNLVTVAALLGQTN